MIDAWFFAAAFFAEVVGTIAGFGSSTIFLPLALAFVDFPTALVVVAFFHVFGNLGRVTFFRHGIDANLLLKFGAPGVLATLAGALLVGQVPQELLKALLGVFLVLFGLYSLLFKKVKLPKSGYALAAGGMLSGLLAGLVGTGGALRGAFLTAYRIGENKYIATSAAIALAVDLTRIPIYLASGFLAGEHYFTLPGLLAVAIAGAYSGKRIVSLLPQKVFVKIVLLAIALAGAKLVYDFLA